MEKRKVADKAVLIGTVIRYGNCQDPVTKISMSFVKMLMTYDFFSSFTCH